MACTLSNKCAKNLFKPTVLLQLIIKNVVTCFFLEHSVHLSTQVNLLPSHASVTTNATESRDRSNFNTSRDVQQIHRMAWQSTMTCWNIPAIRKKCSSEVLQRLPPEKNIIHSTWRGIITGPPSCNWHNLVNMQFIWTRISDSIAEEMLNLHVWK